MVCVRYGFTKPVYLWTALQEGQLVNCFSQLVNKEEMCQVQLGTLAFFFTVNLTPGSLMHSKKIF